jgi:alanine racemase
LIPTPLERVAREAAGELRCEATAPVIIDRIATDSRGAAPGALFVALQGERTDGHRFLGDAFRNGAFAALVAKNKLRELDIQSQWPLIVVPDTLRALQTLARWHRHEYFSRVLAITGSNGKTIVKDALRTLLAGREFLASPGSYNSQLGLPLAVLSAEGPEPLAILEVGISQPGDMTALKEIAAPDYGILTNIGMAHFAAFASREDIAREKMSLFRDLPQDGWLLLPSHEPTVTAEARQLRCPIHHVGGSHQVLSMTPVSFAAEGQLLQLSTRGGDPRNVHVATRSAEIVSDLHFAASAAYLLGVTLDEIAAALDGYTPTSTRMELWSSPGGIRLINDAYSSDPISVHAALRSAAMSSAPGGRRIFAFAGMRELGAKAQREHAQVGAQAAECGFNHLLLVGSGDLESTAESFRAARPQGQVARVANPEQLKEQLLPLLRPGDTVLFKGPRNAGMVKAVRDLSGAIAQRCLWVNLAAVAENIARFRRHCGGAHILAMLKAMAYGTDLLQLASWMSRLGVHHIGVSSANEGVAVRRAGAEQEIFVFLCEPEDVDNLLRYRLTPVIYSAELVDSFCRSLSSSDCVLDVHLKVDTGMHRLGIDPKAAVELARRIRDSRAMRLTGLCTHFAAADDPGSDDFTLRQIALFDETVRALRAAGFDQLQLHAAATAGAVRFPQAHYNMVRIGLGLYGLYPTPAVESAMQLELAIGVTSRITSVQSFSPGDTLGYGRTFIATRKIRVGIIPFGYDDGLPWGLSGKGHVLVEGNAAPILGRISMDQMQIDLTDLPGVGAGAEVLIYGAHNGYTLRPELVAEQAGTIGHELLTRLGERVHRIYLEP